MSLQNFSGILKMEKKKQFVVYSQSDVPLLMFIDTYRIYM